MKIFHHNDNDGKAAAAVVYMYAKLFKVEKLTEDDFISVNYNTSVPNADVIDEYEEVYIVDYSFTEKTLCDLYEISKKAHGNVHWFDHHYTSLDVYEKIKDTKICKTAIVDMKRSGAKIVYDYYLKDSKDFDDFMNSIYRVSPTYVSRVIDLVDDYDRWIHKYPESMLFNIGSGLVDNGPMDPIWFSNPHSIIKKGKIIKEYNDKKNSKIVYNNGFIVTINGKECIVLNTPESSSQVFAEYYDKYKFAIRFVFNGTNYSHSIYSSLEDINCAEIAKYFNPKGGGHKGAAGFVSDKLIFTEGCNFVI